MATYDQAELTYDDATIVYDGMPAARTHSLLIGERDFSDLMDINATSVQDSGTGARSLLQTSIRTKMADAPEIKDQSFVQFVAHGAGPDLYRGFVRSRHPESGVTPMLEIIADDIGGLLDDTYIVSELRPAETLQVRIAALWSYAAASPLSSDLSGVAALGGTLPAQDFTLMSLRQAIEAAMAQASSTARYFVDTKGALYILSGAASAAPFAVVIGTPGAGQIAPEDLDVDYDSNIYANRVYVKGGTPEGSGFVRNEAAITAASGLIRDRVLDAPDCETVTMRNALANMYLGRVAGAIARGRFSTESPNDGWNAGQDVTVTDTGMGLSGSFRIAAVTTSFTKTTTGYIRHYQIEFGASRARGDQGSQQSSHLVYGDLGVNSRTFVTSDGMQVTDGASTVRVFLGDISGGAGTDYGLKVISSDGTTVIIDGTSDMFRIAATGTLTISSGPAAGVTVAANTLLATGLTYSPASQGFLESGTVAYGLPYLSWNNSTGAIIDRNTLSAWVEGVTSTKVNVNWGSTGDKTAISQTFRYYIYEQTAV